MLLRAPSIFRTLLPAELLLRGVGHFPAAGVGNSDDESCCWHIKSYWSIIPLNLQKNQRNKHHIILNTGSERILCRVMLPTKVFSPAACIVGTWQANLIRILTILLMHSGFEVCQTSYTTILLTSAVLKCNSILVSKMNMIFTQDFCSKEDLVTQTVSTSTLHLNVQELGRYKTYFFSSSPPSSKFFTFTICYIYSVEWFSKDLELKDALYLITVK